MISVTGWPSRWPGTMISVTGWCIRWPRSSANWVHLVIKMAKAMISVTGYPLTRFTTVLQMSTLTFVVPGRGRSLLFSLTFVYEAEGKHYRKLLVQTKCYPSKLCNFFYIFCLNVTYKIPNCTEFSRVTSVCIQSTVISAYVLSQNYKCNQVSSFIGF